MRYVPLILARQGFNSPMVEILLDLEKSPKDRKAPPPGCSVIYDKAYAELSRLGYIDWARTQENCVSMSDYYELTANGHRLIEQFLT